MQPEPVVLRAQLAPAAKFDDGQDALCPDCHHITLLWSPWIVGQLTPDRQHFASVEYRICVHCGNPEGCESEPRWVT